MIYKEDALIAVRQAYWALQRGDIDLYSADIAICEAEKKINEIPDTQQTYLTGNWEMHTYMPHHNYCDRCGKDSPYNKRWAFCPYCGSYNEGKKGEGI